MTSSPLAAGAPAPGAPATGELAVYRRSLEEAGGLHDELLGQVDGASPETTSPHQAFLVEAIESIGTSGLMRAAAEARRHAADDGVRYGAEQRAWDLDPLPVVIGHDEWTGIEQGVDQRARLLDALLSDLYGDRLLIRRGVLPAEVVLGHPGFIRQVDGISGRGSRLVIGGHDLGRAADGSWKVIADKTSAPSGAGYAMANRRVISRVLAGLHRQVDLARLRGFFHTMSAAVLDEAPPGVVTPRVALLSPGPLSETAYDQSFLASLLGFPVVESDDLSLRDGRVWIRAAGRLEPVDVLLRRVDPDYCDPLELRADSELGLPGLVEATRRGTVSVANPLGSHVLENSGLAPFLPAVCSALLGEGLLLDSAATWWCGDPAGLDHVLANFDSLVLRPIARTNSRPSVFAAELSAVRRDDLRSEVRARPWAWTGQEPLPLSTVPLVTAQGLQPGRMVLRTFWAARDTGAGRERSVLPGGLARVAPGGHVRVVSSSSGAVSKDVWVLAPDGQPGWGGWAGEEQPSLVVRQPMAVAPRVADNLFWIGRYAERAEATARLLRIADDLVEDHGQRPGTPGAATMQTILDAATRLTRVRPLAGPGGEEESPVDRVRRMVADPHRNGTVAFAADRLVDAARRVRDQLTGDIWHVLSRLERTLDHIPPDEQQLQPQLDNVLESLLAVSGVIAESMVRDESWGFLDSGVRLERALNTSQLLRTVAVERSPIIDGQVTEAVLEAAESIITHRRRTVSGEGPAWPLHSVVSLLMLDRRNPRSVAFQVDRLADDIALVGDQELAAQARSLCDELATLDLIALCAGDRSSLRSALDDVARRLRAISDELARRRFSRKPAQRVLPTAWSEVGS